jgi:hypothetical protein
MARSFVEAVLAFLLMVLALVLPAKTFILGQRGKRQQAPTVQNPARE